MSNTTCCTGFSTHCWYDTAVLHRRMYAWCGPENRENNESLLTEQNTKYIQATIDSERGETGTHLAATSEGSTSKSMYPPAASPNGAARSVVDTPDADTEVVSISAKHDDNERKTAEATTRAAYLVMGAAQAALPPRRVSAPRRRNLVAGYMHFCRNTPTEPQKKHGVRATLRQAAAAAVP